MHCSSDFDISVAYDLLKQAPLDAALDASHIDAFTARVLTCNCFDNELDHGYEFYFDKVDFDDYCRCVSEIYDFPNYMEDSIPQGGYDGDPMTFRHALTGQPDLVASVCEALYAGDDLSRVYHHISMERL